jgi:DNA-binding response OmpR family regulator
MPRQWDTLQRIDLHTARTALDAEEFEPFAMWADQGPVVQWSSANPRILVVDDDNDTRRLIVSILECDGLATLQAPNGKVAMTMALNQDPDLVILDVLMPGLDGYAVCRQLRADTCLHGVPVIMMTGLIGEEEELTGIACGADAYLVKPVSRLELLARVHELI